MIHTEFVLPVYATKILDKTYQHKAPSNIALVKYWGKKENQIPANPSVSFTLTKSYTETSVKLFPKKNTTTYSFDFYFENKLNESFRAKIHAYFERIAVYLPFLSEFHFEIRSENSFPHSSGIASSASGMAALSICLMQIERDFCPEISDDFFWKKASFLARLGSGSACRSMLSDLVVWGEHTDIQGSSNLYGIPYPDKVHSVFAQYQDTILLIDKEQKQVSSSQGHNLMHGHPFAKERFEQAHSNISKLKKALHQGDIESFIQIIESEALTLHAMMLTSLPYFILMKPNTLSVIERIWRFRKETKIPVCFTLDAGANVHLLYPKQYKEEGITFIKRELVAFCENGEYICDEIGATL